MEPVPATPAFLLPSAPFWRSIGKKNVVRCTRNLPTFEWAVGVTKKKNIWTGNAPKLYPTLNPLSVDGSGSGGAPAAGKGEKMIVWFRSDLRLHDHAALEYAVKHSSGVLPLYCFDPRQFGKTSFGFARTGRYRAEFLIEAVEQLRERLRKIGSDLIVREGKPEDVIVELCRQTGTKKVVYHREICFDEQEVEQSLSKTLESKRIEYKALWSNTLYHVDDLPYDVENMPDVYSQFRDTVRDSSKIHEPIETPKKLPKLIRCDAGEMPTLKSLGLDPEPVRKMRNERFTGGEIEALDRLQKYIQDAKKSDSVGTSSSHLGADFSFKISPWLALGCVSPRQIHLELIKQNVVPEVSKSTTYFELVWRDFFRFITFKYSAARLRSGQKTSKANSTATNISTAGVQQQMML